MHWYKLKVELVTDVKINSIGKPYYVYTRNQVKREHSQVVGKPSLVQVGVPHNISTGEEDRLCISLVIFKDDARLSMQQAMELLI